MPSNALGLPFGVFLSHASEDKAGFVAPLAAALEQRGAEVWLDAWETTLGEDLAATVDDSLRRSAFGVVVLSRSSSKY